ncbi:MAG TPA: glycosyltransferase, partial [Actinopolymorphaceae bacterium]
MVVSVVVPVVGGRGAVPYVLAALRAQTYPSDLLEVIVVDDGATPRFALPPIRPGRCRLVSGRPVAVGSADRDRVRAHAIGSQHSSGDLLIWLDPDVVVHPTYVAALVRRSRSGPATVPVAWPGAARPGVPATTSIEEVSAAARAGDLGRLLAGRLAPADDPGMRSEPGAERDHLRFDALGGATLAVPRDLYEESGGLPPASTAPGERAAATELCYRLAQQGAVFATEAEARSWWLDPERDRDATTARHEEVWLADLVPYPRERRRETGRIRSVPLVVAVVPVPSPESEGGYDLVQACVDRLLGGSEEDVRVVLVGDWHHLHDDRRDLFSDPLIDLRLLQARYRGDPRVLLAKEAPSTAFPSPFSLQVPPRWGFGRETLARLVDEADSSSAGVLRVLTPDLPPYDGTGIQLWRTAAVRRAVRQGLGGESLERRVGEVYGRRWVTSEVLDLTDLMALSTTELT